MTGSPLTNALEPLAHNDHPALFQVTDREAIAAQQQFMLATRVRLIALVVSAAGGAVVLRAGPVDIAGLIALISFLVALGTEMYVRTARPDRRWYEARAAAESVKTLTWRYLVGGDPLSTTLPDRDVDQQFGALTRALLTDLRELRSEQFPVAGNQISKMMRSLRSGLLEERKELYRIGRIEDQRGWYAQKSHDHEVQSRRWSLGALVLEMTGVAAAALKAFQILPVDLLGIVSAIAAAIVAWQQAKQFETLSRAYFVASQELASIHDELTYQRDEQSWARFVDQAEEAISREHTMWRASRGVGRGG